MHRSTQSLLLPLCMCIGLLLGSPSAGAQTALSVVLPRVEGDVVDDQGRPVIGAKVFIEDHPREDLEWRVTMPEKNNVLGTSVTDDQGRFVVTWKNDLESSSDDANLSSTLSVFAPNRAVTYRQFSLHYPQRMRNIVLLPESELVGKVLSEDGMPLANAEVLLDGLYREGSARWLSTVSTSEDVLSLIHSSLRPRVSTDKAGRFKMSGLPRGYIAFLQITHPDHPSIRRFQPIDQDSPQRIETPTTTADFATWYSEYGRSMHMPRGERLEVTVLEEATQRPAANVLICTYFAGESVQTDASGKAVLLRQKVSADNSPFTAKQLFVKRRDDTTWTSAYLGEANTAIFPTRRTISGIVRDKVTGAGIGGVGIRLGRPGAYDFAETITAPDGSYELKTYSTRARVEIRGPRTPYVLPVQKGSTSTQESQLKADPKSHVRDVVFGPGKTSATAEFAVEQYPAVKFRVLNKDKKSVAGRMALLTRAYPNEPISTAVTDVHGIAAFTIDRPLLKGIVSIGCEVGFGIMAVDGLPAATPELTLQPAICVTGKISLVDPDGKTEPAVSLPVYLQLEEELRPLRLPVGITDAAGNYKAYLPKFEQGSLELFVQQFNIIEKQLWKVDASADSEVDFAAKSR